MESPGLTDLPVEVIHHISSYLAVQDVLSCSSTCHFLRAVLNDNCVWRRHVPRDLRDLETQEQQVSPAFHLDESLTHLCDNRQHFMRKTHVLNNWKSGRCVQHRVNSNHSFVSGVFRKTKGIGNLIYEDKYIFIGRFTNDIHSDGIEVWDISAVPILHTFFKIDDEEYDSFYLVGSYLVVVECVKVFVYGINLPEKLFPLLYSFLITEENVTLKERIEHFNRHNFRCVGWTHSAVNNYLISNKCGENVLHIWDIHKASKIGSFEPPVDSFSITLHSRIENDLLFVIRMQSSSTQYLFTFNMQNRKFSDVRFSFDGYPSDIICFNSYVILFKRADKPNPEGWHDTVCTLYDFNSSIELKQRQFDNASKNYLLGSPFVHNGRFVVLCLDSFHIVNALTLETIDKFYYEDVRFIVKQINVLDSIFIYTSNSNHRLELWDISKKNKLPLSIKETYQSHLYIDRLFSKLVEIDSDRICAMHFW